MQDVVKYFLLALVSCYSLMSFGQKKNASYELHISRDEGPVRIDGKADETVWKQAEVARNFFMVLPMDTSYAKVTTEVQMAYDRQNIYLLAVCYKALPGPEMVESLRRDFAFLK